MQKTRIEILGLQNKATELRTVNKLSYRQIAEILSKQTGEDISYSVVQRYFSIKEHEKIEKIDKFDYNFDFVDIVHIVHYFPCQDNSIICKILELKPKNMQTNQYQMT